MNSGTVGWRGEHRGVFLAWVGRVIDYLFGALYTLLLIRFALDFFSARTGTVFYQFIRGLTARFYAPFEGLFGTSSVDGGRVVWPLLVAILAYMVLHAAIRGVLHLFTRA
jgi:hypothetical protein